mgnify:CR=1 FL=1
MSFFFKNPQSYFSYLTQIWHFSILPNGEIFNFFIKFWRTYDTSIKMFCEMAKKPPKSNGIFLILPLVRNPSTSERKRVLCLYCGGPGHIAINCPHRPRRQVNQIVACTKPESIFPLGVSDSINSTNKVSDSIHSTNSPSISNKFEILSQLDEELNDWVQPK